MNALLAAGMSGVSDSQPLPLGQGQSRTLGVVVGQVRCVDCGWEYSFKS